MSFDEFDQILIKYSDEFDQILIKYSAGIKFFRKMGRNFSLVSANYWHENGHNSIRRNVFYANIVIK